MPKMTAQGKRLMKHWRQKSKKREILTNGVRQRVIGRLRDGKARIL